MAMRSTVYGRSIPVLVASSLIVMGCGGGGDDQAGEESPMPDTPLINPAALEEEAPATFQARFETTKGEFVIAVTRDLAPLGADRFYTLVKNGYYDDTRFFRVIDGFMAQFGMHANPYVNAAWAQSPITDDPVSASNTRGMVSFAMGRDPNSRKAQIFINFGDNSNLDEMGFAPFGEVVEGMEVVDQLNSEYGEGQPRGSGPFQNMIARQGNAYLDAEFPNLDRVLVASIVEN